MFSSKQHFNFGSDFSTLSLLLIAFGSLLATLLNDLRALELIARCNV